MENQKIYSFNRSRINGIILLFSSIILAVFGILAYYFTEIGRTSFGNIIGIFFLILALFSLYFGIKYYFQETQIWIKDTSLIIKEKFGSAEDIFPFNAVESLVIRKEIQEISSVLFIFSFSTKTKPWSLSIQPREKNLNRIVIYRGSPNDVKKLADMILRYFKWPLIQDTSDIQIE